MKLNQTTSYKMYNERRALIKNRLDESSKLALRAKFQLYGRLDWSGLWGVFEIDFLSYNWRQSVVPILLMYESVRYNNGSLKKMTLKI